MQWRDTGAVHTAHKFVIEICVMHSWMNVAVCTHSREVGHLRQGLVWELPPPSLSDSLRMGQSHHTPEPAY